VVAVSKSDDPERLLAEALRAQAVSAPVTMPPLPAVLTKAADEAPEQPEAAEEEVAAKDEPVTDEAADEATDEPQTGEGGSADSGAAAKVEESEPATDEEPKAAPKPPAGSGDGAFTEEMVLRELSSGPMTGELATIRINNSQHHFETERFSPLENLYGGVSDGPGFGLISGSEVGSTVGPPVGEFDYMLPDRSTEAVASGAVATTAVPTTKMRAERGQVPGWLILLFALVLGLAGGAVAGLLSML
jgi:hypothetical protein